MDKLKQRNNRHRTIWIYDNNQCGIYHCAYVCLSTGPHLPANKYFTIDFCFICGVILNLKAFCFGAIPDIMIELIAYWSVPQSRQSWQWLSGIEITLLGASGYWQKKVEDGFILTRGAILNLTAFCSIWTLIEECSSIT